MYFNILVWGITTGFVLSFITGPAFFALIHTSIEKGFKTGVSLALGVLFADTFFLFSIFLGLNIFLEEQMQNDYVGYIAGSLLIIYGLFVMSKKKVEEIHHPKKGKANQKKFFLKGFIMIITNPGILFYWVSVWGTAQSFIGVKGQEHSKWIFVLLFVSILATQFSMDVLKCFFASKLRHVITPKIMTTINRIAGVIFIIVGLVLLDKLALNIFIK